MPDSTAAPRNCSRVLSTLTRGSIALLALLGAGSAQATSASSTTIYLFRSGADGGFPAAPVIVGSDGNLYGTAEHFGKSPDAPGAQGNGTVFELTPSGQLTVLHTFDPVSTGGLDGTQPDTRLLQTADGSLYGATFGYNKPGYSGYNVVYKLAPDATESILLTPDLAIPGVVLGKLTELTLGADGLLYGAAGGGGANACGALYRMTTSGVPDEGFGFSFGATDQDGCLPVGGLTLASDGNLYGATLQSPSSASPAYGGTLFRISPQGQFTTLYRFPQGNGQPVGKLAVGRDGALYGLTVAGGTWHAGSIFRLGLDGGFTTVYEFQGTWDGRTPMSDLVQGDDGAFYGVVQYGGFFQFFSDGSMVTFGAVGLSGLSNVSSPVPDGNGNFYVTTTSGSGSVARLVPPSRDIPAQVSLTAAATTIYSGDSTTVSWVATNARNCTGYAQGLSGQPWLQNSATSGTYTFKTTYPAVGTQTFWLECQGSTSAAYSYTTTRMLTINVVPPPPSVSLTVSPNPIVLSQTATLSWTGLSVSSCTASGAWSGTKDPISSQIIKPKQTGTATFKLTCIGNDGSTVSASAQLTVNPTPPPTLSFGFSPGGTAPKEQRLPLGQWAYVYWTSTFVTYCNSSGAWSGPVYGTGQTTLTPAATGSYVYTLTCKGINGGTVQSSVKLVVY